MSRFSGEGNMTNIIASVVNNTVESRLIYAVRDDKNLLVLGNGPDGQVNKLTSNLCTTFDRSMAKVLRIDEQYFDPLY